MCVCVSVCVYFLVCAFCRDRPCCPVDLQHEMKSVWCLWCVRRGFLFFRRWTVMHYWSQNTPAMAFYLLSTAESLLWFFFSFCLKDLQFMHVPGWLAGCLTACLLWVMFCFCVVFFPPMHRRTPPPLDSPSHPLPSVPHSTQWEAKR